MAKLSTVDCLEADRLEFYYRIAAQVLRNCVVSFHRGICTLGASLMLFLDSVLVRMYTIHLVLVIVLVLEECLLW